MVAIGVLIAGVPAHAQAQTVAADPDYWKQTAERRSTVYRFVYGQSPQAIPAGYDPVREAEEILRQQNGALPASNSVAREVWTGGRSVVEKTRLMPALRTLGTVGLGVSAFDLGWRIGTGINAKFLRIGMPGVNNAPPDTMSQPQLTGYQEGVGMFFNAGMTTWEPAPADGFLFSWYSSTAGQRMRTYVPECSNPVSLAWLRGTSYPERQAPAPTFNCTDWGTTNRHQRDFTYQFLNDTDLASSAPIEPYTSQPYDKVSSAPSPPAQATVEQTIDQELDKVVNRALRQWLNYALGSPGEVDPTGVGAPNMPDCHGVRYTTCAAALQEHGIQSTVNVLSFEQADLALPAGAVVSTNPAPGVKVEANTVVEVLRNPDAADMPVAVPQPQTDETVDEYTTRAEAVGFVVNPQPEVDADEDLVANAVTRVSPGDRARPSATIDVFFNPDAPETASDEEPDCRLSTPSGIDPLPSAIDYFAIYQGTTFERTLGLGETGFPGSTQTALLVGNVRTVDFTKGGFVGFGYRKIKAKHGWSAADAAATAEALMTAPEIRNVGGVPGRAIYSGAQYTGQNGAICERLVVVALTARPGEPAPRELITSYGRKVG